MHLQKDVSDGLHILQILYVEYLKLCVVGYFMKQIWE